MSKRYIYISVFLFCCALFFSSCKTGRYIMKRPLKEYGADYLLEQLEANDLQFHSFSAKAAVDYYENGKRNSFKVQLRVVKDSVIWMSVVPAMGIEAARIKIEKDSIFFLNRINKTYLKGDFAFLKKQLKVDVDYNIIQALITGSGFPFYHAEKFKASIDGREYRLATSDRVQQRRTIRSDSEKRQIMVKSSWIIPESFKISRIKLKEIKENSRKIDANYDEYMEFNNQLFPKNLSFDLSDKEMPFSINIKIIRIEFDQKKLSFPFKISSKYEPIIL